MGPILAAETGTTVAIVLAVFTLVGTASSQIVLYLKNKSDAKHKDQELEQNRKRSDVEIAQEVITKSISLLDERLVSEREYYEGKLRTQAEQHARDIARLERKIERLVAEQEACKAENHRLTQIIAVMERGENDG